ncbi:MAG TPA: hypothetical protein VMT34_03000 [Aggregatilineales bacterium]|nr:hypothetical protein [Aggregatilineales bacterium]
MDEQETEPREGLKEDLKEFARLLLLALIGGLLIGCLVLGTAWYLNQTGQRTNPLYVYDAL